jgi:hypothetical protein
MSDLVERLRKRAEIRRQIPDRKSVQNNEPDRIADLLEEAANEIEELRKRVRNMNRDKYTYEFVWLPFFKGIPVYWDHAFYNNGDIYYGYRFFCFSIRVRAK